MPVSEPLKLGDKLREALADAQRVLESTDLRGKIKLDITSPNAPAADVESAIDRTEADARKAAETGGTAGVGVLGEGPLSPSNKLIDAMEKLIKSLEGVPDALDKPGRRRKRKPAAGEPPEEDEGPAGPGYMNPYILSGLVQNPLGTMRGMGTSMLMGGAGMGMHPPGWLDEVLGGSSGKFSVGRALAAPTLGGEAGAAAYMGTGAIAAAGVGTFITAFMETLKIEENVAKDRVRDAEGRISDYRMGAGAGINFRAGAWNSFTQSRNDIDVGDIQQLIQSSGVGFQGMYGRGSWQMMGGQEAGGPGGLQNAINTALRIGVSPGQMGSVLGAATRSGTMDVNAPGGTEQMLRYLGLIEQWTAKAATAGLSTSEALTAMAHDAQAQAAGAHGLVTERATRSMLSLRANLERGGMDRPGVESVTGALGAAPHGDTETVLQMNEYFAPGGESLSPEGQQWAEEALGADRVAAMKEQFGSKAGQMIAYAAVQTRTGATHGRAAAMGRMRGNPLAAMALFGFDPVTLSLYNKRGGAAAVNGPDQFSGHEGGAEVGGGIIEGGLSMADGPRPNIRAEVEARRAANVQTALSGMSAEWATSVLAASNTIKESNRQLVAALFGLTAAVTRERNWAAGAAGRGAVPVGAP